LPTGLVVWSNEITAIADGGTTPVVYSWDSHTFIDGIATSDRRRRGTRKS
jgi:hypothetical protein